MTRVHESTDGNKQANTNIWESWATCGWSHCCIRPPLFEFAAHQTSDRPKRNPLSLREAKAAKRALLCSPSVFHSKRQEHITDPRMFGWFLPHGSRWLFLRNCPLRRAFYLLYFIPGCQPCTSKLCAIVLEVFEKEKEKETFSHRTDLIVDWRI